MMGLDNMKSILFYGDSLTYGKIPKKNARYSNEKNFTGVMQEKLKNDFLIISEGLRARTLSGENGFFEERDGLDQFGPILGSHLPLSLVCIFLGTNDCNSKDVKTKADIITALTEYKKKVIFWCDQFSIETIPKILFIAPPCIQFSEVQQDENMRKIFNLESEKKSRELSNIYKTFCEQENCIFFDANKVSQTCLGEGVHLDDENNILLGFELATFIKDLRL